MEKMTKEQILNEWQKESRAANDCICVILATKYFITKDNQRG